MIKEIYAILMKLTYKIIFKMSKLIFNPIS